MNAPSPKDKLRRAVWLAFQASQAVGLGFLHAADASALTEKTILDATMLTDDPGPTYELYTDYVMGRMMKTDFKVDENGKLEIRPEDPRFDYQSWAGRYPSATKLIEAVEKSFAEAEAVPA